MIRTIVTPDKDFISLSLPEEYIGVEIEIIAFTREEGLSQKICLNNKVISNKIPTDSRESLGQILQKESKAVYFSSMEVLHEFESIDDEL